MDDILLQLLLIAEKNTYGLVLYSMMSTLPVGVLIYPLHPIFRGAIFSESNVNIRYRSALALGLYGIPIVSLCDNLIHTVFNLHSRLSIFHNVSSNIYSAS